MVVLYDYGNIQYVICKIVEEENELSYFTIGEDGNIELYCGNEAKNLKEYGTMLQEKVPGSKIHTELEYITREVCYDMWLENFAPPEKENESKKLEIKMMKEFNDYLKVRIIKNLYSYYIKENELDFWKNPFEDRIVKVSDNEFYIDDEKYDIFYKIKYDGEYEIEFLDK